MPLCVASSDQCEAVRSASELIDCACDREKLRVVRTYLHERFPDRTVREFHSHSTVVVPGGVPAPCANYHVVSISDDLPYCALFTRRFLEQPVRELREHLRQWDLAGAIQVDRTVIVDGDGLSQL
jgi:hypothetical protein